jgi:hypothetical protein
MLIDKPPHRRSFGVIIVTSEYDWLFAKGAIASCRYFNSEIPIQLIVDGNIDTTEAVQNYDIQVTRVCDVPEPELRLHSKGWGKTKMLSFWHSQTDNFLYLDSDAVFWGDVTNSIDLSDLDFLTSVSPGRQPSRTEIETWFFDTKFVEEHFPDWDWHAYSNRFFCTGTFAARKGIFRLQDYLEILALDEKRPGYFQFGEMGFLNLMIFRGSDQGKLRVESSGFQVIFPDTDPQELQQRFAFDEQAKPMVRVGDERILHMPGRKPLVDCLDCYSRPMTFFRSQYLRDTTMLAEDAILERLRSEDQDYHRLRSSFLRRDRNRKLRKLLVGHPGAWAQAFRRITRSLRGRD